MNFASPELQRSENWRNRLSRCNARLETSPPPVVEGRLIRMVGLTLEAAGLQAPIGGRCHIIGPDGKRSEAEVVGFSGENIFLMPVSDIDGLVPHSRVVRSQHVNAMPVGDQLLGRVLDGAGRPLDGKPPLEVDHHISLKGRPINPMLRDPIREPLDVGVRAINSLFSVGRGQRMGLFASSGVGKSVLLGMMTKFTEADVVVVGLIGERGREVKEFIDTILGSAGLARSVVVAVPADNPPLMRLHGAMYATSIAEYFRDQGKQVLLLMDSLTRFAQAQRELALAIGEPPATKGYPPSVFAKIPQLVERAGVGDRNGGSITAFYTILTEGDEHQDPIADAARAIMDGHLILSREMAEQGHYPAIDVEASISRVMTEITTPAHQEWIRAIRAAYSIYRKNRDLIAVGAYQLGSDPRIDNAIEFEPHFLEFLRQEMRQPESYAASLQQLENLHQAMVRSEEQDQPPLDQQQIIAGVH